MPYYNMPLRSNDLAEVISDCYEILGRRKTIDLLDTLNRIGFRQSTISGLSFATDDLITPPNKQKIIQTPKRACSSIQKLYQRGIITEGERYNQVLDAWTHAREQITTEMMRSLENDHRSPHGYVNPIFLMAHSGARGGVEQIRQLAGMRGLMAKPSGKIIETPIKANFREGLSVLEYFSSTHGARKGLADTALKTADSGYLTRKLADVAQNVVVTTHDCGTTQGITKGVIYRGEKVEVSLADSIRGRVSRANIVNPITDEVIVRENDLITLDIARRIEEMGLEKIQVRSPMTCDASLGICALCYGMDLSTGALVEEGMAVGIIAAQSIGEPGTQLTMRTFHIGGTAARARRRERDQGQEAGRGQVHPHEGRPQRRRPAGRAHPQRRNPRSWTPRAASWRNTRCPPAPTWWSTRTRKSARRRPLPMGPARHPHPRRSRRQGPLRGRHRRRNDAAGEGPQRPRPPARSWSTRATCTRRSSWKTRAARSSTSTTCRKRPTSKSPKGSQVSAGTLLAKTPREVAGTQDITGGLPRVTEIFEARKPKDPAVIAEIDGTVELLGEKRRGKRTIIVRSESGIEREHLVSHGKHFRVHAGSFVRAGEALVDGPLVPARHPPHLRRRGRAALPHPRNPERLPQPARGDQRQAHRDHRRADAAEGPRGDASATRTCCPAAIMDKFEFRAVNQELAKCLKIRTRATATSPRERSCRSRP